MRPWKCFSFVFLLSGACGPKNGTARRSIFGTVFRFIFWSLLYSIKVAEAQRFGFNEALWRMAAGRATVPTLYACCLTKRSCHFVRCRGRILRFCGLIFGTARRSKNETVKVPFVFLLSGACGPKNGTVRRSHFWEVLHSFVFVQYQGSRSWFGFNGLWRIVPTLYACCLSSCHFLFVAGVNFAISARRLLLESAFLLFFYPAVQFLGP